MGLQMGDLARGGYVGPGSQFNHDFRKVFHHDGYARRG